MKRNKDVKTLKRRVLAFALAFLMMLSTMSTSYTSLAAELDEVPIDVTEVTEEVPETTEEGEAPSEEVIETPVDLETITVSPASILADVEQVEKTFNIASDLPEAFDGTVTYASSDETIATVDANGVVALQNRSGKCDITVTITKNEQQVQRIINVCVLKSSFPWPQDNEYTGQQIKKVVELTCGEETLVEDVDYALSYNNNIEVTTEDSKAKVVITGIGDYKGYKFTREFNIVENQVDATGDNKNVAVSYSAYNVAPMVELTDINHVVDVWLSGYSFEYTGESIKPEVEFYDFDGNPLNDFADNCEISYSSNVDAGQGRVTIRGLDAKGYTGERTETFTIKPLSISKCSISVVGGNTAIYTGVPYEPEVVVTFNGNALVEGEDYTVDYRNNDDIGDMTVRVAGKKNFRSSKDIDIELIGDFAQDAEVSIKGKIGTRRNNYDTKYTEQYSGRQVEPIVQVSIGGDILDESDYTVNYDVDENGDAIDRINVGKVKVRIDGQGKYAGKMIVATYNITPKPLSGCTFEIEDKERIFTGSPITIDGETFRLTRGSTPLRYGAYREDGVYDKNVDYTLEYENNVNVGTATVKAVGVNNYKEYIAETFVIKPKSINMLNNVEIIGVSDKVFTGTPITFPEAKLVYQDSNGVKIELPAEDYEISYANNTNIGTATVTVTGKRNYKDSITTNFEVLPKKFEGVSFTVAGKTIVCDNTHKQPDGSYEIESGYSVVYDGVEKVPTIVIKDGAQELTGSWHYVNYAYVNNTNAGRAYIEVTGHEPYTDQKAKVYFTIEPKQFSEETMVSYINKQPYTGAEVCPVPVVRDGGKVLVKDVDFKLTYTNNVSASPFDSANPPTVTVEGIGNYRGTKTQAFTIGDDLAVTTTSMITPNTQDSENSYIVPYLGTNRPTFDLMNGVVAVDKSNYDVSFLPAGNTNSGTTIQVTCTGKKGYYGTKVFTYTVKQAELGSLVITNKDSMKDNGFNYTYCNRMISVNLEVKYVIDGNEILLVKDKDYRISGIDLLGSDVEGTLGDHTVTLTGIGNYTGTQDVTYTVSKGNISNARYTVAAIEDQVYTGYPIKPRVIITDTKTGGQLQEGVDFEITGYSDNVEIGEGTAKISFAGINNYEGVREVTFNIVQRNIGDDTITIAPIENQIYTGSVIEPDDLLTVYYNGNPLKTTDYDVAYTQNINLGYANVTITGKNNYKGEKTFEKAFKIVGNICDDTKFDIQGVTQNQEFKLNDNGEIDTSNIAVKYKNKEILVDASNYKITPVNCTIPGMGQIKIEGQNGCYGSKTFDVKVTCDLATNKRVRVENIRESYNYTSGQIKPMPVVIYEATNGKVILIEGIDYTVVYGDGTDTANITAGKGTVNIEGEGTYYKNRCSAMFDIVYNLDSAIIEGINASYPYEGGEVRPVPVVKCNGKQLTEGIDYDVEYTANSVAGEGKVIITPHEGSYTVGKREISFKITKASITGAIITYDGKDQTSIDAKDYIAEEIKPAVKVVYNGATLTAGKDYTVGYVNNKNAGEASVKVTGLGNYSGVVTEKFVINPWNISRDVIAEVSSGDYAGGNPVIPLTYLIYKGQTLTEGADYDYTAEFTNNNTVTTTATVTFDGKNNFTGRLVKTFEIKAADLANGSIQTTQTEVPYTGKVIPLATVKSALTVTCPIGQGKTHTLKDTEYDVACNDEIKDAGTYTITVTGKNGFCGTLELSLTVTQKPIDDPTVTVEEIANQPYDGTAAKPEVIVKDTGVKLKENKDYTITYLNNATSGKATVVITGINNYTGELKKYFYIGDSIEGRCEIALQPGDRIVYNGTQQTPDIHTVTLDGSTDLVQGVDYEIASADEDGHSYDYTNAGDKILHIKGIGKYYGESTILYKIYPKVAQPEKIQIELDMLLNDAGEYEVVYNGLEHKPAVRVYDTEISSVIPMSAEDYEVTYLNNVNVGKADVDIKLQRNYVAGTEKIVQFNIAKKPIEDAVVVLEQTRVHYTGEEITPAVKVVMPDGTEIPEESYDVVYENNVCAGKATAVVVAREDGNLSGSISADFIIYASLASDADTTISEIGTQFYTDSMGEMPKPVPEIICGGNELVIGEDVDVTYNYVDGDRTRGKISIVSKKEDFYTDAAERQYDIGVDTSVLVIKNYANAYTYTGEEIKPDFMVETPDGEVLTYNPEEVTYTNRTASGDVVGDVVNVGKVTAKLPLYLDGAPITVNGEQVAATVEYKILPKAITACKIIYVYSDTYTGKRLTPPVTILYNNEELVSGRDYAITYRDNVNPGVASIDVSGCGNYGGKTTLHFTIRSANMVNLTATPASATSIRLDWTKGAKVTGYQVYSADGRILYGTTTGNTYKVGGLAPATTYSFMVRSYVTVGGNTTFGTFKTVSSNTMVSSVPISATSPRKAQAMLTWGNNPSVDGYDIYRSTVSNERYAKVASIPSNRVSYTDRGLTSGKTYYYMVRAYKKINGQYQYGAYTVVQVTVK